MLAFLKRHSENIRGLSTVPGIIALVIWVLSLMTLWLDQTYPEFSSSQPFKLFHTDYQTAQTVLSTVAAAAITTLGLVYSIVLVVFTTAAGNIGPRLLQRFTSDQVNQFTAGLFGGTFLYALTVLHQTDAGFVPSFSIAVTFFLAGLSVLQLIYFVHRASTNVTIDVEVADIARLLERDVSKLIDRVDKQGDRVANPGVDKFADQIMAQSSGYVTFIDVEALVKLAKKHEIFISLAHAHGNFIVPDLVLARIDQPLLDDERPQIAKKILDSIVVSKSRSPSSDIKFSINLILEIALRALSPGVNDTFTAIACVDRISSALARPVRRGLPDQIRLDDNDNPRLYLPDLTLNDLINTAYHPIRRAAMSNILMTKHILDSLGRLYVIGSKEAREVLKYHADLIVEGTQKTACMQVDKDYIDDHYKALFSPKE